MASRFLFVVAVTATLLALSIAIPTSNPNYWWNVTQWDAGCSSQFCSYFFHVAAPMDGTYPGFTAYCAGKDTGFFIACTVTDFRTTSGIPYISAKLKHQLDPTHPNGVVLMGLSLQFLDVDDGANYHYTGHHTVFFNDGGSVGKRFKVFPTKASGDVSQS